MGLESDLPEFKSGGDFLEEVTAARLNAMVRAINAGRLRRGKGYLLRPHGTSGISLEIEKQGGRASSALPLQPFVASTEDTPKIGLTVGTFGANAEAVTGASVPIIGVTRIDDPTPPSLTVAVGDRLLYLKVTVDGDGLITEVKVESTADEDPPDNVPYTTYYVRLCTMTVTTPNRVVLGTYELAGSQAFELCGGSTPLWRLV